MSVLNDKSIREMMTKGKLVVGGDLKRIAQSAYQFVAGRIFPAGEGSKPLSWTADSADPPEFLVPPGGLVWIRTRETVRMPHDLCGFWFQTNTLAREGLMLVNLSIVDPGYEGPLACNFVNFGKRPVLITPNVPLAKMIFVRLDSMVESPFRASSERYDENLRNHALQAPESFLQVTEMAAKLSKEREDALGAIRSAKDDLLKDIRSQLKEELQEYAATLKSELRGKREEEWKTLNTDLNRFVMKSLGVATVVFTFAAFLWAFVPRIQDFFGGDAINDKIAKAVEREVVKRTVILLDPNAQGKAAPAAGSGAPIAGSSSGPGAAVPAMDAGTLDGGP